MRVEGPAVCQTEYEAYVEPLYEDLAQSNGLDVRLFAEYLRRRAATSLERRVRGPACRQTESSILQLMMAAVARRPSATLRRRLPAAGDLGSDAAQRTTAALGTLLGTTVLLLAL